MTKEQHNFLDSVIERYGCKAQTDMAIEEMAELTQALLKYRRLYLKTELDVMEFEKRRANIIEELADVTIMMAQLEHMYACNGEVDKVIVSKLTRQKERMARHE